MENADCVSNFLNTFGWPHPDRNNQLVHSNLLLLCNGVLVNIISIIFKRRRIPVFRLIKQQYAQ